MIKYPIGVQAFEKLRDEKFLYIDKTDLVWQLAQNHICVLSRPRRFGKSLLISTLDCYFQGKKHLFEGLKIMLNNSAISDWVDTLSKYFFLHLLRTTQNSCDTFFIRRS